MQITTLFEFLTSYGAFLPKLIPFVITVAISTVVVAWLRWLLRYIRYLREPRLYFEVTPPASSAMKAEATTELFKILHGTYQTRSILDRVLDYYPRVSLEIIATKQTGIRYVIGCPTSLRDVLQHEVRSYNVDAIMTLIDDPHKSIPTHAKNYSSGFRLLRHFALPLTAKTSLDSHDPLAYVTGAMTGLQENETVIYQLVIIPRQLAQATTIARGILTNHEVLGKLMNSHDRKNSFVGLFSGMNNLLFSILDDIGGASAHYSGQTAHSGQVRSSPTQGDSLASHHKQVALHLKPERVLSNFEQEVVMSIHHKVSEPLFQASLRTLVVSDSKSEAKLRSRSLRSSLSSFSTTQYQSIVWQRTVFRPLQDRIRLWLQRFRLPSLSRRSSLILSASEVSSLFHFPYAGTNKTENIVKSLSRTLPAPLSLKNNPALDVLIGENDYHGVTTAIGLTEKERERHMYVIGGTGNGKTTMLQYMIAQDIQNGKGVAVIDPHGDMAQEIISRIPEERIKDVVYFNPDDLSYPIGLNLLELDEKLEGDDLLREKDLITESVVSIFRKIFSDDDSGGHRIEYILRNATQTALTVKDSTLFTIYDLLNDGKYRGKVIAKLKDENLQKFWRNEFGKAGNFQQVKMAAGITAKVGRFLFSASAKRILEQPTSTINFDSIMDESKILICNFSKGLIGEDTSELLGTAVLAKLQLASLRRARVSQVERTPFYLYVDEFQNFATVSFVQMLSESRKYKLFLTMAEQSTSQQTDKDMVNIILANVGTVVTFRTGNPTDEKILLPLFNPYLDEGEIMNLASFHFYMRLAAVHSQEPLSGMTIRLDDYNDAVMFNKVILSSRKLYAKRVEVKTEKNSVINVVIDARHRQAKPVVDVSPNIKPMI